MALIFPRLARNFVKNGYFPTDEVTLGRILNFLEVIDDQPTVLLDPCCGEGAALAKIKHYVQSLLSVPTTAYGVEFDYERAWHAKSLLDTAAHADIQDMFITARSVGLLFLNPPYGDTISDKAQTGDRHAYNRLEKLFYQKSVPWLAFGGVIILIIPYYVMDQEFATMLARHFTHVQAFMAPEQQFKQIVVFGVKRRAEGMDSESFKRLAPISEGKLPPELPEYWSQAPYLIPSAAAESFTFVSQKIDVEQLATELDRLCDTTLWPQFATRFACQAITHRRPLCTLSDWHLALALAAWADLRSGDRSRRTTLAY